MVVTVAIEGYGLLNNADADPPTGDNWGLDGAGGVSISSNTEIFIQGVASVSAKMSAGKDGWIYYDIGTADRPLDFDTAGTEEGQHVLVWFNITTPGGINTYANYGLCVRMGSDTSNYRSWIISHSDLKGNGYSGGWACAVVDPSKAGSGTDTGTYDPGDVQLIGIYYNGTSSSVADNVLVDTIVVGSGLRITGSDTDGWQDVADYCIASPATRLWGFLQERNGIYFMYGTLNLGDSSQAAPTSMTDAGRVFQFSDWYYADSISTYASSIKSGFHGIVVEDSATDETTYEETGSFFKGALDADTTFVLFGGLNAASVSIMAGVTWQKIDGGFTWGDDSDHSATNCVWNGCAEIDLVGAVAVTLCIIKNYAGELAALLWNASIDITDCLFQDNDLGTLGAAIRHTAGGSVTYYDLTFTSNSDDDVYLNHATASLTVNKDGSSNPTTFHSSGSGSVTFVGTVNLKITVKDADGNVIIGASVFLEAETGGSDDFEETVTITSSGSVATVTHSGHNMSDGEMVSIRGANEPEYNGGGKVITYISATQYSYVISGGPASPATGTITSTHCYIFELTIAGGIAEQSYASGSTQPARGWVRHSTSPNFYEQAPLNVTDISGGINLPAQLGADT